MVDEFRISRSYAYLSISRHFSIDYGDVLSFSDALDDTILAVAPSPPWMESYESVRWVVDNRSRLSLTYWQERGAAQLSHHLLDLAIISAVLQARDLWAWVRQRGLGSELTWVPNPEFQRGVTVI